MVIDKLELDPRILKKNLEITKLTQQIDNYRTDKINNAEEIDIHLNTLKKAIDRLRNKSTSSIQQDDTGLILRLINIVKYLKL